MATRCCVGGICLCLETVTCLCVMRYVTWDRNGECPSKATRRRKGVLRGELSTQSSHRAFGHALGQEVSPKRGTVMGHSGIQEATLRVRHPPVSQMVTLPYCPTRELQSPNVLLPWSFWANCYPLNQLTIKIKDFIFILSLMVFFFILMNFWWMYFIYFLVKFFFMYFDHIISPSPTPLRSSSLPYLPNFIFSLSPSSPISFKNQKMKKWKSTQIHKNQ